jgi:YD repeat-containing protein
VDLFLRAATLLRQTVKTLNATSLTTNSYTTNDDRRLGTAGLPGISVTCNYLANSPLVSQLVFQHNSTARMTTSRQSDLLKRLTAIGSTTNGASPVVSGFAYSYNDANPRTRVALADGTFWMYAYDKLGQVTSAKRYWDDGTPVAGQQHDYAFEDIGNRTSTKAGGDQGGTGLRTASYTANSLNQYTSRDVPGAVDVLGVAHYNATVVGQSTCRRSEYFWKQLTGNNATRRASSATITV